ncbi:MAG: transposase [candidate division Zixibacteria bacterium]|nr:transposase [candidate division Zixibacteria bacterium]
MPGATTKSIRGPWDVSSKTGPPRRILTYYSYPRDHLPSLKTTNPIESIFASVKLRTNAARRIKSTRSALYLIFQLIARAQKRWRRINAPQMVQKVIERIKFENGLEVKIEKKKREKAAA